MFPTNVLHRTWWFCAFTSDFDSKCTLVRPLVIAAAQCTVWRFGDLLLRRECEREAFAPVHFFTSILCKVFIQDELIVAFYAFPLHQSLSSSTKTSSLCVSETFHRVLILPVSISPEVVLVKPFHRGKVMRCLLTCDLHCYIVPRVSLQTVIYRQTQIIHGMTPWLKSCFFGSMEDKFQE